LDFTIDNKSHHPDTMINLDWIDNSGRDRGLTYRIRPRDFKGAKEMFGYSRHRVIENAKSYMLELAKLSECPKNIDAL